MTDSTYFKEAVCRAFEFLATEYGFACVKAERCLVRYESEKVFVELLHDEGRSFEVDCRIGLRARRTAPQHTVDWIDIHRACEGNYSSNASLLQASSALRAEYMLHKMAGVVRESCEQFLIGSISCYEAAAERRERSAQKFAEQAEIQRIRQIAEERWHEEDYHAYFVLLKPLSHELRESEIRKFEYARKHVEGVAGK